VRGVGGEVNVEAGTLTRPAFRSAAAPSDNPIITLDIINVCRYCSQVIKSFANAETERIWRTGKTRGSPPGSVTKRKFAMLDAAAKLEDLKVPPGNRLEKLRGNREGQYSIRINNQYRICFSWQDGNAHDVEVADYH
jgi:toxin HigB-1